MGHSKVMWLLMLGGALEYQGQAHVDKRERLLVEANPQHAKNVATHEDKGDGTGV